MVRLVWFVACLLVVTVAHAAPKVTIEEGTSTKAEGQEGLPGVKMTFALDAPQKDVLAALWADNNMVAAFPTVTESQVLRQTALSKEMKCTEKFMWFESTYVMVLELDEKNGVVRFREKPGEVFPVLVHALQYVLIS